MADSTTNSNAAQRFDLPVVKTDAGGSSARTVRKVVSASRMKMLRNVGGRGGGEAGALPSGVSSAAHALTAEPVEVGHGMEWAGVSHAYAAD
ncbi:hypothetical protein OC844_006664, partial [Tilletia horrida]